MATAHHRFALAEQGLGAAVIRALSTVAPLPPLVAATGCVVPGGPAPRWHELRLFGAGRHPVNFVAGRERVVEL